MFENEVNEYLFQLNNISNLDFKIADVVRFDNVSKIEILTKNNLKIQLWEDVWQNKRLIVESRLKALAGQSYTIPARLCKVRRIDQPTLDSFLNQNHLQNSTKAKFKYGLFLPKQYFRVLDFNPSPEINEILFAVASFSSAKKITRNGILHRSYELIRFANLINFTIVGGFDKLLKAFVNEQSPDDVMTYSDLEWSDGEIYQKLGFELFGKTAAESFWINKITKERQNTARYSPENQYDWVQIENLGNLKFLKFFNQ